MKRFNDQDEWFAIKCINNTIKIALKESFIGQW